MPESFNTVLYGFRNFQYFFSKQIFLNTLVSIGTGFNLRTVLYATKYYLVLATQLFNSTEYYISILDRYKIELKPNAV